MDSLKGFAAQLDLDTATFDDCLDADKHSSEVEKDSQDGQSYGATGTPAFFINGLLLSGAQPFSAFQQIIDQLLAEE